MKSVAILGTVGIPASYGGFETLAENLVRFHHSHSLEGELTVYCSANSYEAKATNYLGAKLRYISLKANGISSVAYDIISLFSAIRHQSDVILLLGVSGAVSLPLIRLLSHARIVTNVDGIEWKREKWKGLAKWFLRFSEQMAVWFSHEVVADNLGIAEHIKQSYGRNSHVIAYGGDHALQALSKTFTGGLIPSSYALALCRIEPENNVAMILEAFVSIPTIPLVFVGNWSNSTFGQKLRKHYAGQAHLYLLDPVYDNGVVRTLRGNASCYIHGHSAGGTNPSLVEMMHFGLPILAYDCIFNRYTTDGKACFFNDIETLRNALSSLTSGKAARIGADMRRIAKERYTWDAVGRAYFGILLDEKVPSQKQVPS